MTNTVRFDPQSGRLRLDAAAFLSLAGVAASHPVPPEQASALAQAGVIVGGRPHPVIGPALATITSPWAQLTVAVMEDERCHVHQGWLGEVSGVLEDCGDDVYDLAAVDTDSLPAVLATLARLGRRPTLPDGEVAVDEDELDALTASDAAVRGRAARALAHRAPPAWVEWSRRVWSGRWSFTVVDVFWPSRDGEIVDRRLAMIDTAAGIALVDAGETELRLVPVSSGDVWERLRALLPDESEVQRDRY